MGKLHAGDTCQECGAVARKLKYAEGYVMDHKSDCPVWEKRKQEALEIMRGINRGTIITRGKRSKKGGIRK